MIRYLGSTKNLAGCVGGLIGLALYLTGVVGGLWPLVVAGLYAVFALLAPPERVRLVSVDTIAEAGQLRADLDSLVGKVTARAQRMPESSVDGVRRIAEVLEDLLSRPERWAANPDVQHAVTRLARTDLPLSVETYLNLPWWFAAKRRAAWRAERVRGTPHPTGAAGDRSAPNRGAVLRRGRPSAGRPHAISARARRIGLRVPIIGKREQVCRSFCMG